MVVGFSVRKQRLDKDKRSGLITRREFWCNREGFYTKKNTPKKLRDSTRCGCSAMLGVKFMGSRMIVVSKFVEEHNHDFVPRSSSHLLRSYACVGFKTITNVLLLLSSSGRASKFEFNSNRLQQFSTE